VSYEMSYNWSVYLPLFLVSHPRSNTNYLEFILYLQSSKRGESSRETRLDSCFT
jgi:hypothetical protein